MLLVLQTLNTLAPPTKLPLMYRPVEFTHSLVQPPGASIAVDVNVVVPTAPPKMMLQLPVVTAQPAQLPRNMFWTAVVLQRPA